MMKFAAALVAASLTTFASAIELDIETKTDSKDNFTPISMADMTAPPPTDSAKTEDAAPTSSDATQSEETQPAADPAAGSSTDEKPAITVDTDSIPTPTVNEQEEAPKSEHPNIHPHGQAHKIPYDDYFLNPEYKQYSYDRPGPDRLPGADFNKQVYEFNEMNQIWHQSNYQERVKVEAEIMVTLEALKTSVRYMTEDTADIQTFLSNQFLGVKSSSLNEDAAFV